MKFKQETPNSTWKIRAFNNCNWELILWKRFLLVRPSYFLFCCFWSEILLVKRRKSQDTHKQYLKPTYFRQFSVISYHNEKRPCIHFTPINHFGCRGGILLVWMLVKRKGKERTLCWIRRRQCYIKRWKVSMTNTYTHTYTHKNHSLDQPTTTTATTMMMSEIRFILNSIHWVWNWRKKLPDKFTFLLFSSHTQE